MDAVQWRSLAGLGSSPLEWADQRLRCAAPTDVESVREGKVRALLRDYPDSAAVSCRARDFGDSRLLPQFCEQPAKSLLENPPELRARQRNRRDVTVAENTSIIHLHDLNATSSCARTQPGSAAPTRCSLPDEHDSAYASLHGISIQSTLICTVRHPAKHGLYRPGTHTLIPHTRGSFGWSNSQSLDQW